MGPRHTEVLTCGIAVNPCSLCFVGCLAGIAPAQTQVTISCADFARNPDGSWSPVKPFTLGGITMGPGVKFTPGVLFNGLDFASALNQHCQLLQQYNKRCPAGKFSAGFFIAADSTANTAYHKVYSCVHICPHIAFGRWRKNAEVFA